MNRSDKVASRRGNEALALSLALAMVVIVLAVGVWPGWQAMEAWLAPQFFGTGA